MTRVMDEHSEAPAAPPRRSLRLLRTQRTLQIILGLFWLLDAGLQFQPFMFGSGFTTTYLLHNAQGQPAVIGWIITNVGHFVGPHIALWNTLFALMQVAIGGGLLFRRTVRPALLVSFFWVLGVWFFGEGLGLIFTGSASALTGAPGSVLLYGALGLMAWPPPVSPEPDRDAGSETPVGVASSAAGQGLGGAVTPLAVWGGYWSLAAVLFLLPDNRTHTSVSSAIVGMSAGEPRGYSHFLTNFGNHFSGVGTQSTWLLAIASLIIGLGPLVARRISVFLLAGAALAAVFWISGQGLGGVFTDSGTDPNSGPLVIALAFAMVPAAIADRSAWRSPFSTLLSRRPVLALGSVAAVGLALFLSAVYPVAATESTGTAMSGMHMPGSTGPSASAAPAAAGTSSCTTGNGGQTRSGLDLANSPYMAMGGSAATSMNMNGADASAAAGFNTTKTNWHYTGPALPNALAQQLIEGGPNGPGDIHMAATGCAVAVTASQQINATQYVQTTSQAAARYPTAAAALAAGYVAVSPTSYPVVTYVTPWSKRPTPPPSGRWTLSSSTVWSTPPFPPAGPYWRRP